MKSDGRTQGDDKRLGPASTLYGTVAPSFVIPSVPGFPTSQLSPATTYVVLPKENHMHLTEAATLDRKSGEAEGSAVLRTLPGNVFHPVGSAEKGLGPERLLCGRQHHAKRYTFCCQSNF